VSPIVFLLGCLPSLGDPAFDSDTGAPTDGSVTSPTAATITSTTTSPSTSTTSTSTTSSVVDADRDGHPADGDCDDTDPAVYPGAPEVCLDRVDGDCDGEIDEGCGARSLADADAARVGGEPDEHLGRSLAGLDDLDGDGHADLAMGTDLGGVVLLWGGPLDGGSPAETVIASADPTDGTGWSLARAGDLDGDGGPDLLVGAPFEGSAGEWAGAALLVSGGAIQARPATLDPATLPRIIGEAGSHYVGVSVAGPGDVDGDGWDDALIGAHGVDSEAGVAYLVRGPLTADRSLADATARLMGQAPGDYAGYAVAAAGDTDGDGLGDLLVGAYGAADEAGFAGLFAGPLSGSLALNDADEVLSGASAGDRVGYAVAGVGDVDGDGLADLLIGAPGLDTGGEEAGGAYLLISQPVVVVAQGGEASAFAGISVAGAGDIDGDGLGELLVGAHGAGDGGRAYLFWGGEWGSLSPQDAALTITGEGGDAVGLTVAGAGDIDGDGRPDLLIGAPRAEEDDAGAAALLLTW